MRLQRAFPRTRVVESLDPVDADVMVHPRQLPGHHVVLMSGNASTAKQLVRRFLWRTSDGGPTRSSTSAT